ncbi:hypothetical protein NTG1052_630027 [Candidatus Nitrotoga sp. 1052]|nr:hypothetical protein NTG1052_630027 [Candidatus Nitrotoga sp. 1052]
MAAGADPHSNVGYRTELAMKQMYDFIKLTLDAAQMTNYLSTGCAQKSTATP